MLSGVLINGSYSLKDLTLLDVLLQLLLSLKDEQLPRDNSDVPFCLAFSRCITSLTYVGDKSSLACLLSPLLKAGIPCPSNFKGMSCTSLLSSPYQTSLTHLRRLSGE